MSLHSSVRLSEVSTGPGRYIEVPRVTSNLLHIYLWSNGIQMSLPITHSSEVDRIELDESVDLDVVQRLLNRWA